MIAASLIMLSSLLGGFVVEASAEKAYVLEIPREVLSRFVDDIGLFRRHMPGVVAVDRLDDGSYLYRTEKKTPLSGTFKSDFIIARLSTDDTLTVYRSVDSTDPNFMSCSVRIISAGEGRSGITVRLHLRLERPSGGDVHWMAPILGERFISERMQEDLEAMLSDFVRDSSVELYDRCRPAGGTR